ncbi:MAG: acetylxylan esterase [Hyphomicrobiales bacterium]|nr:acetylxylan esterase [Hyphomicrobiales bacterium]
MTDESPRSRAALRALLGNLADTVFSLASQTPISLAVPSMRAVTLDLRASDGSRVRGILTGPAGEWQDLPAVLYCHAHGNRHAIGASELLDGRPAILDPPYGEALAARGLIALCIDMPTFGGRAGDTESGLAKRRLWEGRTLFGQMLADLGGALALLRALPGVDPDRIGVMGLSMGATHAFWLGALHPDMKVIAHLCCFADLATLVETGAHDLHGHYMTVPGLLPLFSTGRIAGLAAPTPQLAMMGHLDPLTPPAAIDRAVSEARAAYAAAGVAEAFEVLVSDDTGHVETPAMRAATLAFLSRTLSPAQPG